MQSKPNHDLAVGKIDCCQICGSSHLELVIDLGHQAPCDSLLRSHQLDQPEATYPLRFLRCPECSLAQIDYVVPPEELFYPDYPYRSGITPSLVKNLRSTSAKIIERHGLKPGSLAIDIGSNDGTLLSGFKDLGMRVLGIEPTNIAHIANDAGIETVQSFFSEKLAADIVAKHGHASAVTAANMFAHVASLGDLIRGVEHLLQPGGVFVSESHYLLDLIETVQYDSIYHEHLKFYSLRSMIRLFDFYNFTVADIERIPNYGGSIRVYAVKGKGLPVSQAVTDLLAEEERFGLYDGAVFTRFALQVRKSRQDLQRLAIQVKDAGHTMVGVGCPGRSSTLLNYAALDSELMPYIAEQSTSLKLGMFLPGKHIPIVDEERMFREQPEYAVMLSWHYWEPIVAKLRQKGLKSKIVLPLPELRVIES
ncbi:class I SAM-dependent methyltransferase [Magnetospirillum sp. 15-1]|uniref:class I SAM-dependent methyltransferase n=1 Tax=Magnetospirillum sp. 15-1 TaxID=1979370 RepID=UPI000BBC6023|nr:class I SAM-dependent methyltransferase [Magnetospirillum sp. 15-1]